MPAVALAAAFVAALTWPTDVPSHLGAPELDPHAFFSSSQIARADDYEAFTRVNQVLSALVLVAVLVLYARRGARFMRESAAGRIGTGMLLAMLGLALVWLAELPFGVAQLWWDRRYDVADLGYLEWVVSSWFALSGVFIGVCLTVLIVMAIAAVARERWWLLAVPAFAAIGLLVAFISPYLVPDVEPLHDRGIAADARRLERQQGLPRIDVEVQRAKQHTTEINAASAGFGPTRRVILWDTLLEALDRRQVRFVLAHELGHHSRDHILKTIGWSILLAVPSAFLVAVATRRRGGIYRPEAIPLALLVFVVLTIATTPIQNSLSRRFEAEADWVALETTRDPAAAHDALLKLGDASLEDPDPRPGRSCFSAPIRRSWTGSRWWRPGGDSGLAATGG